MPNLEISSTLAALVGSAIGACAPVLNNYISQKGATRRELLNHQISERESLYSEFIRDAAKLHVHSLTHDMSEIEGLVGLHATVAQIRLLSSEPVVTAAENFVLQVVTNYGQPNASLEDLRSAAIASKSDPLYEFSYACRSEFRKMSQGAFIDV